MRRVAALSVGLGLTAIVATAALAASRQWAIEPTPNPAGTDISVLSSVSCPSRRTCVAVGSSAVTPATPTLPLAERWDGARWRIQAIPAPKGTSDTLFGVSCPSARACVAVGNAFRRHRTATLAEAWDGRRWRIQAAPALKPSASLYSVSCTSRRACTAVGFSYGSTPQPVVERWDGKAWHVEALPRTARSTHLLGVSCARARACTAVGYQAGSDGNARTLAETWNGRTWRVHRVPVPHGAPAGVLEAVSCTSARACTATGTDFDPRGPALAERWNGTRWRVQRTPDPANFATSIGEVSLDGVSCTSPRACTASGEYSPGGVADYFIESWDGRTWRLEDAPRPLDFQHGALLGMSCASARCTAVGGYTGSRRLQVDLALAG